MAFRTLEKMASCYVDLIQAKQKKGPYRLGAWCSGGLIIYEMARQLKARGEEVEVLIIISGCAIPEYYQEAILPEFFNKFFVDNGIEPESKRAMHLKFGYLYAGNVCYDYLVRHLLLPKENQRKLYEGRVVLLHPEDTQEDKHLQNPENG